MKPTPLFWTACFVTLILVAAFCSLLRETQHARDESECRDMIEERVKLMAQILSRHPHPQMIRTITQTKFFPDQSGYFFVMDFAGNLHGHGEMSLPGSRPINLKKSHALPFHKPVDQLINKARGGGGYVKYNWKGRHKLTFVHPVPQTSFFIGSGLCMDPTSLQKRKQWKTTQKHLPVHHTPVGDNSYQSPSSSSL